MGVSGVNSQLSYVLGGYILLVKLNELDCSHVSSFLITLDDFILGSY